MKGSAWLVPPIPRHSLPFPLCSLSEWSEREKRVSNGFISTGQELTACLQWSGLDPHCPKKHTTLLWTALCQLRTEDSRSQNIRRATAEASSLLFIGHSIQHTARGRAGFFVSIRHIAGRRSEFLGLLGDLPILDGRRAWGQS